MTTDSGWKAGDPQQGLASAVRVQVRGSVQGVGFRPEVWRQARAQGLRGWVCNDAAGVSMLLCGRPAAIARMLDHLRREPPLLARIDAIECAPAIAPADCDDFRIIASRAGAVHTVVVADAATCPACRDEILDPAARRYRYAFANCTHCGPRLSIIEAIPYDRSATTMRSFRLCEACAAEYGDPADRRFHAQPIACATCGPNVWLQPPADGDPIAAASAALVAGQIVAIKALGGFHLACDAGNAAAVARLRQAKRREAKPFALMARDVDVVRRYAVLPDIAVAALTSPAAPIVLLRATGLGQMARESGTCTTERTHFRHDRTSGDPSGSGPRLHGDDESGSGRHPTCRPPTHVAPGPNETGRCPVPLLAAGIAPGLTELGFMLPCTPLHHLLLHGIDRPLVMTSGNLSDEPQCISNDDAVARLGSVADRLLLHDRPIARRVDDSVVRPMAGAIRVLRRARGYAPAPLRLGAGFDAAPPLLAMGGELKNTFALLRDGEAILSHHMGDLENAPTFADYRRSLAQYRALFDHRPAAIAVDAHPDYLPSKLGRDLAAREAVPVVAVQHHHAHLAACLAENGVPLDAPRMLGIVLDGLGWGEDGTIWGGEFLLGDYRSCRRLACLKPVAMPGGAQAVREPWRNAYAHIAAAIGWDQFVARYGGTALHCYLAAKPLATLDSMIARGVNAPLSSSCGRLFDAVAAALGLCRDRMAYEGQAAMLLEAAVTCPDAEHDDTAYRFAISDAAGLLHLDPAPLWPALLDDIAAATPVAVMARRFHVGLAIGIARMVAALAVAGPVALSGGVLQNRVLLEQVIQRLTALGVDVLTHRAVPANDGGLALGQAAVAAARLLTDSLE